MSFAKWQSPKPPGGRRQPRPVTSGRFGRARGRPPKEIDPGDEPPEDDEQLFNEDFHLQLLDKPLATAVRRCRQTESEARP